MMCSIANTPVRSIGNTPAGHQSSSSTLTDEQKQIENFTKEYALFFSTLVDEGSRDISIPHYPLKDTKYLNRIIFQIVDIHNKDPQHTGNESSAIAGIHKKIEQVFKKSKNLMVSSNKDSLSEQQRMILTITCSTVYRTQINYSKEKQVISELFFEKALKDGAEIFSWYEAYTFIDQALANKQTFKKNIAEIDKHLGILFNSARIFPSIFSNKDKTSFVQRLAAQVAELELSKTKYMALRAFKACIEWKKQSKGEYYNIILHDIEACLESREFLYGLLTENNSQEIVQAIFDAKDQKLKEKAAAIAKDKESILYIISLCPYAMKFAQPFHSDAKFFNQALDANGASFVYFPDADKTRIPLALYALSSSYLNIENYSQNIFSNSQWTIEGLMNHIAQFKIGEFTSTFKDAIVNFFKAHEQFQKSSVELLLKLFIPLGSRAWKDKNEFTIGVQFTQSIIEDLQKAFPEIYNAPEVVASIWECIIKKFPKTSEFAPQSIQQSLLPETIEYYTPMGFRKLKDTPGNITLSFDGAKKVVSKKPEIITKLTPRMQLQILADVISNPENWKTQSRQILLALKHIRFDSIDQIKQIIDNKDPLVFIKEVLEKCPVPREYTVFDEIVCILEKMPKECFKIRDIMSIAIKRSPKTIILASSEIKKEFAIYAVKNADDLHKEDILNSIPLEYYDNEEFRAAVQLHAPIDIFFLSDDIQAKFNTKTGEDLRRSSVAHLLSSCKKRRTRISRISSVQADQFIQKLAAKNSEFIKAEEEAESQRALALEVLNNNVDLNMVDFLVNLPNKLFADIDVMKAVMRRYIDAFKLADSTIKSTLAVLLFELCPKDDVIMWLKKLSDIEIDLEIMKSAIRKNAQAILFGPKKLQKQLVSYAFENCQEGEEQVLLKQLPKEYLDSFKLLWNILKKDNSLFWSVIKMSIRLLWARVCSLFIHVPND